MAGKPSAQDGRDDAQLLAAIAQSRDQSAFDELLRRYERDAYSVAYHITGRRDAAEEVVQDAMMRVWNFAASYRGEGHVRAWLLRIVVRESTRLNRTRKWKTATMESKQLPSIDEHSPLSSAESSELANALRREFSRLPELERQLVGLSFAGGLTQDEISEALSIPQQTVSYRIGETLKRLRENLSANGYAAAVPLMAAGAFGDVLTSGTEAPPGLHSRILKECGRQHPSLRSRRGSRPSVRSNVGLMTGIAIAAAVATAGIIWASMSKPAPQPVAAPVAVAQPVEEARPDAKALADLPVRDKPMERPADWHRRWTFEKGAPSDLFVMMGEWQWNRESKAMDIPKSIYILPTYLLPDESLLFTANGVTMDLKKNVIHGLIIYKHDKKINAAGTWKRPHRLMSQDTSLQCYIYRQRAVLLMNNEPGMVFEYDESLADAVVFLQYENYSIRELIATPLKEDEIPEFVKNPEQIKKDLTKN